MRPSVSIRQRLSVSRSASDPPGDSATCTTSSPSGSASLRDACTAVGSSRSASPISRYSASLAEPVGAAPAYEIRGWGWKPDEYAIGSRDRTSARSNAREKSRWDVNRSRPRFA